MYKTVFLLITLMFIISCQNSNSEIVKDRQWKGGPLLGDWITFSENKNEGLYVSNDTIYKNGKPEAIITSVTYEIDHYVMNISSLDGKQKGTYFDKGRTE
ncbi:MAG: hypothetical protein DI539_14120 [Flavobacterium psychrophilum]|nr:MAG: hypothetical protein DI539_14120 [Flavobacterium psychrophilum]